MIYNILFVYWVLFKCAFILALEVGLLIFAGMIITSILRDMRYKRHER